MEAAKALIPTEKPGEALAVVEALTLWALMREVVVMFTRVAAETTRGLLMVVVVVVQEVTLKIKPKAAEPIPARTARPAQFRGLPLTMARVVVAGPILCPLILVARVVVAQGVSKALLMRSLALPIRVAVVAVGQQGTVEFLLAGVQA